MQLKINCDVTEKFFSQIVTRPKNRQKKTYYQQQILGPKKYRVKDITVLDAKLSAVLFCLLFFNFS